jgi:hypothetical protein
MTYLMQGMGDPSQDFAAIAAQPGGTPNKALSPEAMAKILGLFSGADSNAIARAQANRPTFAPVASNPGHIGASQIQAPEMAKTAPQQVVPSLAQILGLRG